MNRLGYDRYGAQGGDTGAVISPGLGRLNPDKVVGCTRTGSPRSPRSTRTRWRS